MRQYGWFQFDAYAPVILLQGGAIAAGGGIAAIALAIALSVLRAHEARDVTTYGSARWADAREVRRAGLLGDEGVVLGRFQGHYLRPDGPEHVLCFAPTRSGKGVGLVIPTLLTWPASTIVHDIKGENFQLTSGWRARFGPVLVFDPTNPATPKERWSGAIIGKRPAIRCSSARSCMSSTLKPTRRSRVSQIFCPTLPARSRQR